MIIRMLLMLAASVGMMSPATAQSDLVAAGERVFTKCQTCHLIGPPTKRRKSPPHLNDLFGRKPGSLPNVKYSEALIVFGRDKIWDEASLTLFLRDPQGVVKGTNMRFLGLLRGNHGGACVYCHI